MNSKKFLNKKEILITLATYFFTPFLYNLFVVVLNQLLFIKVSISEKDFQIFKSISEKDPIFQYSMIFSFLLPSAMGVWYSLPLWKDFFRNNFFLSSSSKTRIVNSALFSGVVGFLGWFVGFLYTVYLYISQEISDNWFLKQFLFFLFEMILCFSLVYYTLDYFNRVYVFPKVLKDNELLELKGKISLKIVQNFFIYYITSVIMPVLFLFGVLSKLIDSSNESTQINEIVLSVLIILLFTGILTYSVIQNLIQPISKLKEKAILIQEGRFGDPIFVDSSNEIGELSQAMNQMSLSLQEKEKMKDIFGRTVDPRIRDLLIQEKIQLGGEIQNISILFCDIRGFTTVSERLEPKKVMLWLNQYFQKMEECITSENGIINKFIGDAILAIFGTPIPLKNHSLCAVQAARKMNKTLENLNQELKKQNLPYIEFGIGIHTGNVLVGSVGSHSRSEYTVIGDAVNIASRVESLCKEYKTNLLFTESVYKNIIYSFEEIQFLGDVDIRGRVEKVKLYTLIEK